MKMNRNSGFNLLECLLASMLGAVVLTAWFSLYLNVKASSHRQQVIMEMQDTGRFLQAILNQRIREAGFAGCVDPIHPVIQNQAIIGYDSGHLPPELQNQVIPGTDVVVIQSCVAPTQIGQNAQWQSMAYYIGDTHRLNQQGQPIFALFQKPGGGDREELAAGVEQMKILYGVAFDLLPAAQITDWQAVNNVQLDMVLNSVDAALTQPQPYYFYGQMIAPDDLLLHQEWSTAVSLWERVG